MASLCIGYHVYYGSHDYPIPEAVVFIDQDGISFWIYYRSFSGERRPGSSLIFFLLALKKASCYNPAVMSEPDPNHRGRKQYWINMTLAIVAGQVGCLTLVIIMAAVLAGLWLDNAYGTKPTFTIGLLLASIPVSVTIMFFVVRAAVGRIKTGPPGKQKVGQEENILGDDD